MAASPADAGTDGQVLARVFGGTIVQSATAPGPASHDGLGRRFVFIPAAGDEGVYALDVEHRRAAMPAQVMDALDTADEAMAFRRWTALEVVAKLTDVPILSVLREARPPAPGIEIMRADTPVYWVAVGKRL